MEHEDEGKPIVVGALGTVPKGLEKGLKNWKSVENCNHPDYRMVKIGQNTEKKLDVFQIPEKEHQLIPA